MRAACASTYACACMHALFSIKKLKNSEKYFQIFHTKIKLKIIIFKNSKFSFKGGFVPDIFAGATALKWFQTPSLLEFSSPNGPKNQCVNLRKDLRFFIIIPPLYSSAQIERNVLEQFERFYLQRNTCSQTMFRRPGLVITKGSNNVTTYLKVQLSTFTIHYQAHGYQLNITQLTYC